LHLLLWLIFRQMHPNFINVRTAYASKIRAHLTKNLLIKSSAIKIPRVHKNQKEDFPYGRYTGEKSLSLLPKTHNAF